MHITPLLSSTDADTSHLAVQIVVKLDVCLVLSMKYHRNNIVCVLFCPGKFVSLLLLGVNTLPTPKRHVQTKSWVAVTFCLMGLFNPRCTLT